MNDFKSNIKHIYQEEVNPSFQENNWNDFINFRNSKKKKSKRRFFIIILFLVGLSLASLFLFEKINSNSFNKKDIVNPIDLLEENIRDEKPIASNFGEGRNHAKESSIGNTKVSKPELNGLGFNQKIQALVSNVPINPRKAVNDKAVIKNISYAKAGDEKSLPAVQSREDDSIRNPNQGNLKKPTLTGSSIAKVPPYKIILELPDSFTRLKIESNQLISGAIEVEPKAEKRFLSLFYVGLAYPYTNITLEENAHFFGTGLKYFLSRKLAIRYDMSMHSVDYISEVMDHRIGIRSIDAPRQKLNFDLAEVESKSLEVGLGLDYYLLKSNSWNLSVGTSYGIAKEFIKDVDYYFEGEDDNDIDDDEIISISNDKNFFVNSLLKVEMSFSYRTKFGGMHLSVLNPIQLGNRQSELLHQARINIGINKAF